MSALLLVRSAGEDRRHGLTCARVLYRGRLLTHVANVLVQVRCVRALLVVLAIALVRRRPVTAVGALMMLLLLLRLLLSLLKRGIFCLAAARSLFLLLCLETLLVLVAQVFLVDLVDLLQACQ